MTWYKLNEKLPKIKAPIIIRNNKNNEELTRYSLGFLDKHQQIIDFDTGAYISKTHYQNFSWRYIND